MYQKLKLYQKDAYWKPLSQREKKGVYFCRLIGFDEELLIWERKMQIACQKNGKYISKKLMQPSEGSVSAFFQKTGFTVFSMEKRLLEQTIAKWLDFVPQSIQKNILDALFHALAELSAEGNNLNILKNAFVKFMCWLKEEFGTMLAYLGGEQVPKVLYEGDISKYELYLLRILSLSGCDIVYVNFLEETSYFKIDAAGVWSDVIYGKKRGNPPKHFSKIDLSALQKQENLQQKAEALCDVVKTNMWLKEDIWQAVFQKNSQRTIVENGCFYNLFVRYIGIDQLEIYQNRLYDFEETLKQKEKTFLLLEDIENPSIEEVNGLRLQKYETKKDIIQKLSEKIYPFQDTGLQDLLQRAFFVAMQKYEENTISKFYNTALKFMCWLNRYSTILLNDFDKESMPILIYYGKANESEALFLEMLSYLPIDVLYISPEKENDAVFEKIQSKAIKIELEKSHALFPFPKKAVKVKLATTAYQAERELDTLLYTDTGLFRQRQFTRSHAVTLKTVYEEIFLLWKEEAKYRPGFEIKNASVTVPNIFAKINGVKQKDEKAYFKNIATLLTENTIFIKNFPYIAEKGQNPIAPFVTQFYQKGKILPDVIKKHPQYPYDFLNLDTQDYILEKIQEMIDLHWIIGEKDDVETTILSVTLNLDKKTVQLIQQFDFTKEVPKVIVVSVNENVATLQDAVYLLFLNLIGFDIAVFTPTGYRNIEKYISKNAFEEYEIGEYLFQIQIPKKQKLKDMAKNISEENGLLTRLFKRRKG